MTDTTQTAPTVASTPTVVIVGRPNVGKSTLFNRIIGSQQAIVEDRPGITRDRKTLDAEWLDVPFRVVDTGGWMPGGDQLEEKVSQQVESAVADVKGRQDARPPSRPEPHGEHHRPSLARLAVDHVAGRRRPGVAQGADEPAPAARGDAV